MSRAGSPGVGAAAGASAAGRRNASEIPSAATVAAAVAPATMARRRRPTCGSEGLTASVAEPKQRENPGLQLRAATAGLHAGACLRAIGTTGRQGRAASVMVAAMEAGAALRDRPRAPHDERTQSNGVATRPQPPCIIRLMAAESIIRAIAGGGLSMCCCISGCASRIIRSIQSGTGTRPEATAAAGSSAATANAAMRASRLSAPRPSRASRPVPRAPRSSPRAALARP